MKEPENLKVPVLIDLPIPANINPGFLVLLHYHLADGEPERLYPYVYQAGNKWYAQFALTSFSDFVLTQERPTTEILTLPAGTKEIGEEAFSNVSAHGIVVPEGCVSIGSRAFSNCEGLMEVQIPKSVESIADDAFEGTEFVYIVTENEMVKQKFAALIADF